MKPIKSNDITSAQHKAAKIAGFMFLFGFLVPTLNWALVLSPMIVSGNAISTATNILDNESLFRIGISIELILSLGLIVLASSLYTILKDVNRNLALLALLWKIMEATLVAVMVVVSFITLHILTNTATLTGLSLLQYLAPAGILLNQHTALYSILMVFLGFDMILFCYLFFKSLYIPRLLAGFGIISFLLILIHSFAYIVAPNFAVIPINQIIFWSPSGIFEIIIGFWLLIKGLNVKM